MPSIPNLRVGGRPWVPSRLARGSLGVRSFTPGMSPWKATVKFVSEVDKLERRVEAKEIQWLYQGGRYTQRTMRRLIKPPPAQYTKKTQRVTARYKREVISREKRPPWDQTGQLRNGIAFEVDRNALLFRCGPELRWRQSKGAVYVSSSTVPQLLEEGGTVVMPERKFISYERDGVPISYWRRTGRMITARYRAFPYVEPAREKAWDKFQEIIKREQI